MTIARRVAYGLLAIAVGLAVGRWIAVSTASQRGQISAVPSLVDVVGTPPQRFVILEQRSSNASTADRPVGKLTSGQRSLRPCG
jgi:hypothetical protein